MAQCCFRCRSLCVRFDSSQDFGPLLLGCRGALLLIFVGWGRLCCPLCGRRLRRRLTTSRFAFFGAADAGGPATRGAAPAGRSISRMPLFAWPGRPRGLAIATGSRCFTARKYPKMPQSPLLDHLLACRRSLNSQMPSPPSIAFRMPRPNPSFPQGRRCHRVDRPTATRRRRAHRKPSLACVRRL